MRPPASPPSAFGAPPPRRWWPAALVVALVTVVLALAALRTRLDTSDLEDRIVREAAKLEGPHPRPIHRLPAVPGSAAERIAAALPGLRAAADAIGEERFDLVKRVADGTAPLDALPVEAARALDGVRASLETILDGTRTAAAELPPAILIGRDPRACVDVQLGATFAALYARRELVAGRARAASAWCVDGLALGRDLSIAMPGLMGRMIGAAGTRRLARPCEDVLNASSRPDRRALAAELRAIREGTPSFAAVMGAEGILSALLTLELLDDPALVGRLPPVARGSVRASDTRADPALALLQRLLVRDAWRTWSRLQDELAAAAALDSEADRDAAFARALQRSTRTVNPIARIAPPDPTKYAHRADAAVLELDALVLLAAAHEHRARHGRWPARVEDLAAEGLLDRAEVRRLRRATLVPAGEALRMELKMPALAEPRTLTLTARAQ